MAARSRRRVRGRGAAPRWWCGCRSRRLRRRPGGGSPKRDPGRLQTGEADGRPRLLIVEDQRDAAEGLAELMRMRGFAVEIALDGTAGLASVEVRPPAVVLVDLGLRGLDGFEVARRLRQLPGGREAMVIALSGYGRDEDRQRGAEAGVGHHLVKPGELRALHKGLAGG